MVLVDTSVWIDHLRRKHAHLYNLLQHGQVACHPLIIGELACGNLRQRAQILALLKTLPGAPGVNDDEALRFIESHALMGLGIGIVDVHLLAASRISGFRLWTSDKRFASAIERLNCAYRPS